MSSRAVACLMLSWGKSDGGHAQEPTISQTDLGLARRTDPVAAEAVYLLLGPDVHTLDTE
jgi:hypothetical protein